MNLAAFRELATRAIAVDLGDRMVVRVRGEDPLGFLDATTSQDLSALAPAHGALTCLLDDKGRVLAEARVLPFGDGNVLLDGEPAARAALTGWLARIAPLSACEVIDESERWTLTAIRGPSADVGIDVPSGEHGYAELDGTIAVRVEWGPPGYDVLAKSASPSGARVMSVDDFDAARIAAGRTRFGIDITPETLVNETPLVERAVSHGKGCYPGQESVARVRNLGRLRSRLVLLRIDGDLALAPGTRLEGDRGTITSAGVTPSGAVAIARVRAEVEDGATVIVDGAKATVHDLL